MTIDISGSGLGTPSLPPTQTFEQWEKSAKAQYNHVVLNVLADLRSADVSIAQWNPVERHRTSADRPTLPRTAHTRISGDLGSRPEKDPQPLIQELLRFLPPDVLTRLLYFRKLPLEQRDAAYVALDNALTKFTAGAIWLDGVTTTPPTAEAIRLAETNTALPYQALLNGAVASRTVWEGVDQHLATLGPNDPHYDKISQYKNELEGFVEEMEAFSKTLDEGDVDGVRGEAMATFADKVQHMKEQLDGIDIGPNGQILGTALDTLTVITHALALEGDQPEQFLGLAIATKDIDLGKDLGAVIRMMSDSFVGVAAA